MRVRVEEALAARFPDAVIEREVIPDVDWVAKSLEGLKPVRAGRFLVHGSHDRDKVRPAISPSRSMPARHSAPAITARPRAALK
jgi:ribosomal protein L11 methylase PrmA